MSKYSKDSSIYKHILLILVFVNAVIFKMAFLKDKQWYWVLGVTICLLLLAVYKQRQAVYTINYRRRSRPQSEQF